MAKEIFSKTPEKHSVSQVVLSFVDMFLNGSDLVVNDTKGENESALTISQHLHFNTRKHKKKHRLHEKSFPMYLGLMIHVKTIKKFLLKSYLVMD